MTPQESFQIESAARDRPQVGQHVGQRRSLIMEHEARRLELAGGFGAALGERGNREAFEGHGVREIERADFRRNFEVDRALRGDGGRKIG